MILLASFTTVPTWFFIVIILGIMFAVIAFLERGRNPYPYDNNRFYRSDYDRPQDYYPPYPPRYERPQWTPESGYELRMRRSNPVGTLMGILFLAAILAVFLMGQSNKTQTIPEKNESPQDSLEKAKMINDLGASSLEISTIVLEEENQPEQYWDDEYAEPDSYEEVPTVQLIPRFTMQTGFFLNAGNADNRVNQLRKSFPTQQIWIEEDLNNLAQQGSFVFIGTFATEAAAKLFSNQLRQQGFEKGLVVPLVVQ